MTVCANRTDSPGSFTSCQHALGRGCVCGEQVAAEAVAQSMPEPSTDPNGAHQ